MKDKFLHPLYKNRGGLFTLASADDINTWVFSPDPHGFFTPATNMVYQSSRPGIPVERLTDGSYEAVDPLNTIPDGWMVHTDYLTPKISKA